MPNVYHVNGYATAIQIASTELMKTARSIIVPNRKLAAKISLLAVMAVVLIKDGFAIMITIAATVRMKVKSATLNTKHVLLTNSVVKTSNVYVINIDATARMIVAIILTRLGAVSHLLLDCF